MISIGFTGDFCPWERIEEGYSASKCARLFQTVQPFFEENDLNILDLECPLTTSKNQINKTGPHIKAHPKTAEILNYLNCKLVATANNHFKDYNLDGMKDTYESLKKHEIDWLGSGNNYEEASKTYFWEKDNLKFAIINVTENEWSTTYDETPGCHPLDLVNVFNQIQKAKNCADFIIVIAHGGHENYELPSPKMKKWFRFFVDAGADTVIGHHTHIISGYELYNNAPIFYSLGNFCFDWVGLRNKPWNKGMLVRLKFEKNQPVFFELDFFNQNNKTPGVFLMNKKEKEDILSHVLHLNAIIENDDKLENEFKKFTQNMKPIMNTLIQPYLGKYLPGLYKRGFLPSIISKEKKLLYTNLIRCESHRDLLISAIKPTQK